MYNNRIRQASTNLDLQSLIRRCDIAFDERARYVEFVCSVWNEGRFGPDLADPVVIDRTDRPAPRPASFLDLHDSVQNGPNWPAPTHARSILGRAGSQTAAAASRMAKQMGFSVATPVSTNLTSDYPANQGRGSPRSSGTQVSFSRRQRRPTYKAWGAVQRNPRSALQKRSVANGDKPTASMRRDI